MIKVYDQPQQMDFGWRIGEDATHYYDVVRKIFNWRVTRSPKLFPGTCEPGFCYFGTDVTVAVGAIMAAQSWLALGLDEPPGWNKHVATGEIREYAENAEAVVADHPAVPDDVAGVGRVQA